MERSRELAKQKICSYLKADGLPVSTTGAPGRAYHGLYNCDKEPLDVILSLDASGSVRLYCQSQYPLEDKSTPGFDNWFFKVAMPKIEKGIAAVPCLCALRRRNCRGRNQRIVMDVRIRDVNWKGLLDKGKLESISKGYAGLIACLKGAKVFAWTK